MKGTTTEVSLLRQGSCLLTLYYFVIGCRQESNLPIILRWLPSTEEDSFKKDAAVSRGQPILTVAKDWVHWAGNGDLGKIQWCLLQCDRIIGKGVTETQGKH